MCAKKNSEVKLWLNFLSFVALFTVSSNREVPNYLLPVDTKPQMKEIQPVSTQCEARVDVCRACAKMFAVLDS